MRRDYDDIVSREAEVVVVGPDNARQFAAMWAKERYPFVGIPDPRHEVLDLYGQEVKLLKLGRLPAQLVVDKGGVVRFAHYGSSMADIPDTRAIIALLDGLGDEA